MSRQLKLRLIGDLAKLGEIPASDVAKLILAMEKAVADAAAQIVGRTPGLTGRKGGPVEAATRFRLVGVRKGSVMPVLELPRTEGDDLLDVGDTGLGDMAVNAALDLILGETADPWLAGSLARIGDEIGLGTRYTRLQIEDYAGTRLQRTAVLDRERCDALELLASEMPKSDDGGVVGTLFEADFEKNTARVRTPSSRVVTVSFARDLADQIHEVMRHQTELVGRVRFNPSTGQASSINVERVITPEQLLISLEDTDEFWTHRTVDELLEEHAGPVAAAQEAIRDPAPADEEIDAFFEALGID